MKEKLLKLKHIMSDLENGQIKMSEPLETQIMELIVECYTLFYDAEISQPVNQWILELFHEKRYGFSLTMDQLKDSMKAKNNFFQAPRYLYKVPVETIQIDQDKKEIVNFLKKQNVIRVLIDNGMNYGNQATNINLITYLRQMGFEGILQIVYSKYSKDVINKLLHLNGNNSDKPILRKLKLQLIDFDDFAIKREQAQIDAADVGITAALNIASVDSLRSLSGIPLESEDCLLPYDNNFARFLNVKLFLKVPYAENGADVRFQFQHNSALFVLEGSQHKQLVTRVGSFAEAENYLYQDTRGMSFSKKAPAFLSLVNSIKEESIYFLPVYSRSLREKSLQSISRYLTDIIKGARYAHERQEIKKPLVIAFFQTLSEEAKAYLTEHFGNKIVVCQLHDTATNDLLTLNNPDRILILETGPLPKILFDGLFTHTGATIWPPVREGVGSGTALALRGKAHAFCQYSTPWEVLDLVSVTEKTNVERLDICRRGDAEAFGKAILDANKNHSKLTKIFVKLKQYFENPHHNKIDLLLSAGSSAIDLKTEELNQRYSSHLYFGFYGFFNYNKKQPVSLSLACAETASPELQTSTASRATPNWMQFIRYATDPVANFISARVSFIEGTGYFNHPNYWGSPTTQTMFRSTTQLNGNTVMLLNQSAALRIGR